MKIKITLLSLMLTLTGCITKVDNTMVLGGCDAEIEGSLLKDTVTNGDAALDKQALLELLPGSTVYQDRNEFVQVGFYAEDNTITGNVWGSWEDYIDKGSWMVSDSGQLCNQWSGLWSIGEGQNCYSVYPGDGEDQFMIVPDSDNSDVSSLKTDAEIITITPSDVDEFE